MPALALATVLADAYMAEPDTTGSHSMDCAMLIVDGSFPDCTVSTDSMHECKADMCLQTDLQQTGALHMRDRRASAGSYMIQNEEDPMVERRLEVDLESEYKIFLERMADSLRLCCSLLIALC